MFNFMKKGVSVAAGGSSAERDKADRDEKEKRKREKKLRKESKGATGNGSGLTGSMSTEELLRLDEVRRSLKIRGRRKEKEKLPSGITAYSAEFFAALNTDCSGSGGGGSSLGDGNDYEMDRGNEEIVASVMTTIENRFNGAAGENGKTVRYLPPVPPKPPKRGILKGSRSNISNVHEEIIIASPESQILVMHNTIKNEQFFDSMQRRESAGNPATASFTSMESLRSENGTNTSLNRAMTLPVSARYSLQSPTSTHLGARHMSSPSPSADDSLTDTTNSSFATPPFSLSPIGECQGTDRWLRVQTFEDIELPLPAIKLVQLPPARRLIIRRQKSPRQDFGFSLRKAICLDRSESLTTPSFKPVIFAEPGAGGSTTGLLPGDRLLKVNDTPVAELPREVIIEMIRNSSDAVTVEVQPVAELVELSRRCLLQHNNENIIMNNDNNNFVNDDDETDRAAALHTNCNTLKRSASKRFKQQVSEP